MSLRDRRVRPFADGFLRNVSKLAAGTPGGG